MSKCGKPVTACYIHVCISCSGPTACGGHTDEVSNSDNGDESTDDENTDHHGIPQCHAIVSGAPTNEVKRKLCFATSIKFLIT